MNLSVGERVKYPNPTAVPKLGDKEIFSIISFAREV